jgi:hypothetical protein
MRWWLEVVFVGLFYPVITYVILAGTYRVGDFLFSASIESLLNLMAPNYGTLLLPGAKQISLPLELWPR